MTPTHGVDVAEFRELCRQVINEDADRADSPTISPTVARHGACRLLPVDVDRYNVELKDDGTFLGNRASKGAFRAIIENWRKPLCKIGVDPQITLRCDSASA